MSENINSIEERINTLSRKSRKRIGLIIKMPDQAVLDGLRAAQRDCDLLIVGQQIDDFESVPAQNNYEDILISLLVEKKVDGIVRGQGEYQETLDSLKARTGTEKFHTPAIIKDVHGHVFTLSPVNDFEGHTVEEKVETGIEISKWLDGIWGIEPEVVVMCAWRGREWGQPYLKQTQDDAEEVVEGLASQGIKAIVRDKLDHAVKSGNVVIPVNGMLGHTIYRALCMLGDGHPVGVPMLGSNFVVADHSKYETDFSPHIRFASAWANLFDGREADSGWLCL